MWRDYKKKSENARYASTAANNIIAKIEWKFSLDVPNVKFLNLKMLDKEISR